MKHLKTDINEVAWLEEVLFKTDRPFTVNDFRVYVQARDFRWYKQHNPIEWARSRFGVLCQFGDPCPDEEHTYIIVALRTAGPLQNVYECGQLPQWLMVSEPREVIRCRERMT